MKSFGYDVASPDDRKIPGNYNVINLGLNYRMSEIESAIGLHELKKINKKILIRKLNYEYFFSKIKNLKNIRIINSASNKKFLSSYYCLTIILKNKSKKYRNDFILKLKRKGIQTSIYYPNPVPLLGYYKKNKGTNLIDSPWHVKLHTTQFLFQLHHILILEKLITWLKKLKK